MPLKSNTYRAPSLNDRVYRRSIVPAVVEENTLVLRVSEHGLDEAEYSESKRQMCTTCACTHCNQSMQIHDTYVETILENVPEETHRLDDCMQTERTHSIWQTQENSVLTSDCLSRPNDNNEDGVQSRTSPTAFIPSPPQFISNSPTDIGSETSIFQDHSVSESVPISNANAISLAVMNSENSLHITTPDLLIPSAASTPACGFDDLFNLEKDSELSNHDRSAEKFLVGSQATRSSWIESSRLIPTWPLGAASGHARQVANRVIKHARDNKVPDERSMWCPNCGLFPVLPVTGQCGHTRCTRCIENHGACPCGVQAPRDLHVNTLIQDLIGKMLINNDSTRPRTKSIRTTNPGIRLDKRRTVVFRPQTNQMPVNSRRRETRRPSRVTQRSHLTVASSFTSQALPNTPLPVQARFDYARQLVSLCRYREAVPHLARVAARSGPLARIARTLLSQTISALSNGRDPRRLTRDLFKAIRSQSATAWLSPIDLECVLCYHTYTSPVTTPCGHTYCRTCIERSMDYRKSCALCLRSLDDFDLSATRETAFVCAALVAIDALNPTMPPDPDVIPIFVCTVAYPTIPCPLFIFDPRYWLMIRRVLESGSRKFGIVAYERDRTYSDYGTVLEVCDCVHLEDGRSILSTVGVSRFRVIERDIRDGCDVARIQPLADIMPTEEYVIWELRLMASHISYKALMWFNNMNRSVRSEIETAFGKFPEFDQGVEEWRESPDGPAWLWWLIAILPLRSEIKVLILATKNLLKRMMAVLRTLEVVDHVAFTSPLASQCEFRSTLSNTEQWLEQSTR